MKRRKYIPYIPYGETSTDKYEFICRGCSMGSRKTLWDNFTSSLQGTINRETDNSYMIFEPEPSNIYDPNAVKIICKGEFFGTMGYIGKEYNEEFLELIGNAKSYRIDMKDEAQTGQKEITLVLSYNK